MKNNSSFLRSQYSIEEVKDDKFVTKLILESRQDEAISKGNKYIVAIDSIMRKRVCLFQEEKITKTQHEKRHAFKEWMDKYSGIEKLIPEIRRSLGIENFQTQNIPYKDYKEAIADLIYQIWFETNGHGDFDEDILENETRLLSYLIPINKLLNKILSFFNLAPGWKDYLVATIASPGVKQSNITYRESATFDYPISVYRATDNSIALDISSRATKGDWDAIWKAIKPLIKANASLPEIEDKDTAILNERPLEASVKDFNVPSLSELAAKYYPEECHDAYTGIDFTNDVADRLAKRYKYQRKKIDHS